MPGNPKTQHKGEETSQADLCSICVGPPLSSCGGFAHVCLNSLSLRFLICKTRVMKCFPCSVSVWFGHNMRQEQNQAG